MTNKKAEPQLEVELDAFAKVSVDDTEVLSEVIASQAMEIANKNIVIARLNAVIKQLTAPPSKE